MNSYQLHLAKAGAIPFSGNEPGNFIPEPVGSLSSPGGLKVFILSTTTAGLENNDIKAKLIAFDGFSTVDAYDFNMGPLPSLATLMLYDCGIVYTNVAPSDQNAVGDLVSDYVDNGGRIVVMCATDILTWEIQGRYLSTGKNLIPHVVSNYGLAALGERVIPSHPILEGVSSFSGGTFGGRSSATSTVNGGILVARWSSGEVFAAISPSWNVVCLNFFPASSDYLSSLWTGDGARLMRNALVLSRTPPVGGTLNPVNTIEMMSPWATLVLTASIVACIVIVKRRKN